MHGERVSFSIQDISWDIKTENITKTTKGETSVREQHFKPNIRNRTSRNPPLIWEERGAFTCMSQNQNQNQSNYSSKSQRTHTIQ